MSSDPSTPDQQDTGDDGNDELVEDVPELETVQTVVLPVFEPGVPPPLPPSTDLGEIMDHQAKCGKTQVYTARFRKLFLSTTSQYLVGEFFWCALLSHFRPLSDNVELHKNILLDLISVHYTALFTSLKKEERDAAMQHYPDCAAHALYTTFHLTFPHLRDDLKDTTFRTLLATDVIWWMTGMVCPEPPVEHWHKTQQRLTRKQLAEQKKRDITKRKIDAFFGKKKAKQPQTGSTRNSPERSRSPSSGKTSRKDDAGEGGRERRPGGKRANVISDETNALSWEQDSRLKENKCDMDKVLNDLYFVKGGSAKENRRKAEAQLAAQASLKKDFRRGGEHDNFEVNINPIQVANVHVQMQLSGEIDPTWVLVPVYTTLDIPQLRQEPELKKFRNHNLPVNFGLCTVSPLVQRYLTLTTPCNDKLIALNNDVGTHNLSKDATNLLNEADPHELYTKLRDMGVFRKLRYEAPTPHTISPDTYQSSINLSATKSGQSLVSSPCYSHLGSERGAAVHDDATTTISSPSAHSCTQTTTRLVSPATSTRRLIRPTLSASSSQQSNMGNAMGSRRPPMHHNTVKRGTTSQHLHPPTGTADKQNLPLLTMSRPSSASTATRDPFEIAGPLYSRLKASTTHGEVGRTSGYMQPESASSTFIPQFRAGDAAPLILTKRTLAIQKSLLSKQHRVEKQPDPHTALLNSPTSASSSPAHSDGASDTTVPPTTVMGTKANQLVDKIHKQQDGDEGQATADVHALKDIFETLIPPSSASNLSVPHSSSPTADRSSVSGSEQGHLSVITPSVISASSTGITSRITSASTNRSRSSSKRNSDGAHNNAMAVNSYTDLNIGNTPNTPSLAPEAKNLIENRREFRYLNNSAAVKSKQALRVMYWSEGGQDGQDPYFYADQSKNVVKVVQDIKQEDRDKLVTMSQDNKERKANYRKAEILLLGEEHKELKKKADEQKKSRNDVLQKMTEGINDLKKFKNSDYDIDTILQYRDVLLYIETHLMELPSHERHLLWEFTNKYKAEMRDKIRLYRVRNRKRVEQDLANGDMRTRTILALLNDHTTATSMDTVDYNASAVKTHTNAAGVSIAEIRSRKTKIYKLATEKLRTDVDNTENPKEMWKQQRHQEREYIKSRQNQMDKKQMLVHQHHNKQSTVHSYSGDGAEKLVANTSKYIFSATDKKKHEKALNDKRIQKEKVEAKRRRYSVYRGEGVVEPLSNTLTARGSIGSECTLQTPPTMYFDTINSKDNYDYNTIQKTLNHAPLLQQSRLYDASMTSVDLTADDLEKYLTDVIYSNDEKVSDAVAHGRVEGERGVEEEFRKNKLYNKLGMAKLTMGGVKLLGDSVTWDGSVRRLTDSVDEVMVSMKKQRVQTNNNSKKNMLCHTLKVVTPA